jgi:hypothetical protein
MTASSLDSLPSRETKVNQGKEEKKKTYLNEFDIRALLVVFLDLSEELTL